MTLIRLAAIAGATALSLTAFSAVASNYTGNLSQEDQASVESSLKAAGYELRRMEMEDGKIEAYAVKDGMRYELLLDKEFKIIRVEQDD